MGQRAEVPVQVPGDEGGGEAAGLLGDRPRGVAGGGPAALEQRTEQVERLRATAGPTRPVGSARRRRRRPRGRRPSAVRPDRSGRSRRTTGRSRPRPAPAAGRSPGSWWPAAVRRWCPGRGRGGRRPAAGTAARPARSPRPPAGRRSPASPGRRCRRGSRRLSGSPKACSDSTWVTTSSDRPTANCRSMWEKGSSRAPNFEEVRRTPLATARILPRRRRQHGDDPVRLAELVRPQHHGFVAVRRHLASLPDVAKARRTNATRVQGQPPRPPDPHPSGARPPALPADRLPRHVAIVMDGNGRWAKARNLPRTEGHAARRGRRCST